MKTVKHKVLYVPGLGDTSLRSRELLLRTWNLRDITIEITPQHWTNKESWPDKIEKLLAIIDRLTEQGFAVSLIGESAGASAVLSAYGRRKNSLHAVILVCGKSQYPGRVSPYLYRNNPALRDAITESTEVIRDLSADQKNRILNIHPLIDPVVPVKETLIPEVRNVVIPSFGHALSIVLSMTIFRYHLINFVRKSPYDG